MVVVGALGASAFVAFLGIRDGQSAGAPKPGIPVGAAAPPFSLIGRREPVTLDDFHGRGLVLAFVTRGCASCAAGMQRLGTLAPKLIGPAGARTYYVVVDRGQPNAGRVVTGAAAAGVPVGLLFASDPTGATWRAFRVRSPGTIFVIGPNGRVAWRGVDPPLSVLRTQTGKVGALVTLP
jgi:Redoxin